MGHIRRYLLGLSILIILIQVIVGPPTKTKKPEPKPEEDELNSDWAQLEYAKYLKEVVNVLESDKEFKTKLEKAHPDEIKSGNISVHMDILGTNIRDRLTELKRIEVQRQQELIKKMIDTHGPDKLVIPEHFDVQNLNTFEKDDLRKLVQKATKDLEEIDNRRKIEFKEYEMRKEAERRHKLASMTAEERQKEQEKEEQAKKHHKEHPKLKHPGSKDQLEEVWEDVDELPAEDFDANTFFSLHDLDNDGYWNEMEIEALFQKELDKVYNESDPDDDMTERFEEMNRMREHVVKQMDKDQDMRISRQEFMDDTKTDDYKKDEGWDAIGDKDDSKEFTDEELEEFEKQMAKDYGWGDLPEGGYPGYYPPGRDGGPSFAPPGHGGVPPNLPPQPPVYHGQPPPPHPSQGGGPPPPPYQGQPPPYQQVPPHQGMPQQGMPQQGVPQQGIPQQGVPQQGIPQQGVPQQGVPQQGVPQQGIPQQGVPQQGIPQQGVPQQGVPVQQVQQQGQPVQQQQAQPQAGASQQQVQH